MQGGRQPRVQWGGGGTWGKKQKCNLPLSVFIFPLLCIGLPKEQSSYDDQQHNHNSPYDAWQGLSTVVSR